MVLMPFGMIEKQLENNCHAKVHLLNSNLNRLFYIFFEGERGKT
jgi:hypothetical protein